MAPRNLVLLLCLLLAACYRRSGGSSSGVAGASTAPGPTVTGFARYYDDDGSASASAGDRVVVPFSAATRVNGTQATALALAVLGDDFGAGASLAAGPGANEVRLTLGDGARLKTRQTHSAAALMPNAASGIDVSPALAPDAIEDASSGADALPSIPVDLVPGFVAVPALASGAASGLAVADLDRDGHPDLVLARSDGGFVTWIGAGDGTFQATDAVGSTPATCVALADLNHDGRVDVLLGTGTRDEIWLSDVGGSGGASRYVLGTTLKIDEPTAALAAMDLDFDGDLDLVAAGQGALRVYANDGAGLFPGPSLAYGGGASALRVADVDRDGLPDVLVGDASGTRVWRGDGAGGLAQGDLLAGVGTTALAVADVDLDGDLDLLAGGAGGDTLWLGDGAGAFDAAQAFPAAPTVALEFVDVDGDARPDLIVGGPDASGVWLNVDGTFAPVEQLLAPQLAALVTADLDGDADPDLALATAASGTRVFTGSLSGTWGAAVLTPGARGLGPGPVLALAAADADRDGDADLAAGADTEVLLFVNEREESFAPIPQRLSVVAGLVRDLAFADVDRDGDLDLLAIRREDFVVFLNDGEGNYSDGMDVGGSASIALSAFSLALDVGDVDRDGDLDVVVGNLAGVDVLIPNLGGAAGEWLGFGQRVRLPQAAPVPERTRTTDLALADVDGDGDLDLALTQAGSRPELVYTNDGAGGFAESSQQLGARSSAALAVRDLDVDGDPDLVIATDAGLVFWSNDGAGVFTQAGVLGSGPFLELLLRDLDGDGYAELLAVRDELPDQPAAVLLWAGGADGPGEPGTQGGPTPAPGLAGPGYFDDPPTVLATGRSVLGLDDLDLDGDLDLVLGFEDPALLIRPFWSR